jgi:transcriptional regulator with XRE-family HTH domain
MKFRHALGEVIRETRHELGLNLRDVSQLGSVALGYLSEVERGHKEVSSEILDCIAKALGLPTYQLIELSSWKMKVQSGFVSEELELDLDFVRH